MNKSKEKIVEFNIFCDKKNFYRIIILSSLRSMYDFRKALAKMLRKKNIIVPSLNNDFAAECLCTGKAESGQIGVILFSRHTAAKVAIVTHEITHAVSFYWPLFAKYKWNDIQTNSKANEKLAFIAGEMARQYWLEWYKSTPNKIVHS